MFNRFNKFLRDKLSRLSTLIGSPLAFLGASLLVVFWAALGPSMHYSDAWMLIINTLTTILTFLIGFSIQFTQNRDTKEIKKKINALMRQNDDLSDQLDLIEKELSDEENEPSKL